jgi:hypothetical protein
MNYKNIIKNYIIRLVSRFNNSLKVYRHKSIFKILILTAECVYKPMTSFMLVTCKYLLLTFPLFNIAYARHICWVTSAGPKENLGC